MTKVLDSVINGRHASVEVLIELVKPHIDSIVNRIVSEFSVTDSDSVSLPLSASSAEFGFLFKDKSNPFSIDVKLTRVLGLMLESQESLKVLFKLEHYMDGGIKRANNRIDISLPFNSTEKIFQAILKQ